MIRIPLTPTQREAVEWAFGAMQDYWGNLCAPGFAPDAEAEGVTENDLTIPADATMPFIDGRDLVLSTWDEINDDLAFRIGEQLPDMTEDAIGDDLTPSQARRRMVACLALHDQIFEAMSAKRHA